MRYYGLEFQVRRFYMSDMGAGVHFPPRRKILLQNIGKVYGQEDIGAGNILTLLHLKILYTLIGG